jgi:hypothetical protein
VDIIAQYFLLGNSLISGLSAVFPVVDTVDNVDEPDVKACKKM